VVAHGSMEEIARAKEILSRTGSEMLDYHQ